MVGAAEGMERAFWSAPSATDTTGLPAHRYSYSFTGSVASVIGFTLNGIRHASKWYAHCGIEA